MEAIYSALSLVSLLVIAVKWDSVRVSMSQWVLDGIAAKDIPSFTCFQVESYLLRVNILVNCLGLHVSELLVF